MNCSSRRGPSSRGRAARACVLCVYCVTSAIVWLKRWVCAEYFAPILLLAWQKRLSRPPVRRDPSRASRGLRARLRTREARKSESIPLH